MTGETFLAICNVPYETPWSTTDGDTRISDTNIDMFVRMVKAFPPAKLSLSTYQFDKRKLYFKTGLI